MGRRAEPLRFVCRACGRDAITLNTGNRGHFCNKSCRADFDRAGPDAPRRYIQDGYWMLCWTERGGAKRRPVRRFQFEHRRVWEQHNGPIPEGLIIHHINEIKTDNRIENLQLVRRPDHNRHHDSGAHGKVA